MTLSENEWIGKKWDVTRKCLSMQTRNDDDEIQLVIVNE